MSARIEHADAIEGLRAAAPGLGQAMADFMALAFTGPKVDIVTRELVRIYSGQQSHCTYCSNTRVQGALKRGMDEAMVAQIADFEHSELDDRQKAALRLAQAFLLDPTGLTDQDRAELRQHYRADQLAELILDLIRLRPGSKMHIAAGLDEDIPDIVLV
jgi:AhpD family alkylhydroperoxidase